MSDETVIELSGVDVTHTETPHAVVARAVDWRIGRGDFWVVGGAQASGRTSLLMTAAGLNRPAAGTLRIFGRDLAEAGEEDQVGWRRRIGFVFEHGGRLMSHLNVAENIALPLQYHRDLDDAAALAKVNELLAKLELERYANQSSSRLSLRIQQRVSLARALAAGPEILFLDNPLWAMSARDGRWWLNLLNELKRTREPGQPPLTLVVSADDFRGWLEVADRFAILEGGRFQLIGGREQVEGSREPVVREFLESII
jgi:phospholipid/cholesterol/gamma-HCH transport system ATP-binding protein